MLKRIATIVLAAIVMSPAAAVADDAGLPDLLFKNTLRVENRFAINDIFFEPDHTWTSVGVTVARQTSGTWTYGEGSICVTQTNPPQPAQPLKSFCEALAGKTLGDTWEKMDPRNGLIRTSLVAGRSANPSSRP
ncbi:MAG: hypothetical protein BGN82_08615 [Alphaproteobacteria bacterium 65-7]|nr:MAG: hypothetical protein BGN82_08615 [Alphaproteobacteria bacterium 65-7]